MNRRDESQFAAEVVDAAVARSGVAPVVLSGTVESATDERGDVEVRLDGPELPAGAVTESAQLGDADVVDSDTDLNQALPMRVIGDPPARGQRVLVLCVPGGSMYVIGSVGGSWRLLGGVIIDNTGGSIADDAAHAASSDEEEIELLSCVCEVVHLRRWIEVNVQAVLGATVPGTAGIGRIYAEDEGGNTMDLGRFALGLLRGAGTTGTLCTGSGVGPLDPGRYRFYVTASVPGGFTTIWPNTRTAGFVKVTDEGPIPDDVTWPDDPTWFPPA